MKVDIIHVRRFASIALNQLATWPVTLRNNRGWRGVGYSRNFLAYTRYSSVGGRFKQTVYHWDLSAAYFTRAGRRSARKIRQHVV